jgi:HAMP domain-containing protein
MFRRLRELPISLAAKCQILFGAAVVLIISAALFVPWQRMEQLTEQLNEKAAAAVARTVVADHLVQQTLRQAAPGGPTTSVATSSTQPAIALDEEPFVPPRLIPAAAAETPEKLTRFEQGALDRFTRDRKLPFFARKYDNERGYRFAQPLYATADCTSCHIPVSDPQAIVSARDGHTSGSALPQATQPQQLLGMVSIDIPTQISTRQLLLNRMFILTAGLIAGVLAIIIFYLVTTRLILQPVRVLQETAEKVSEGDLNIRSDINTGQHHADQPQERRRPASRRQQEP